MSRIHWRYGAIIALGVALLGYQPVQRLALHQGDQCRGLVTDGQIGRKLGLSAEQVEEIVEGSGNLDDLCGRSPEQLAGLRERSFSKAFVEYMERFQRDDSGQVALSGYADAIDHRRKAAAAASAGGYAPRAGVAPGNWTALGPFNSGIGGRINTVVMAPGNQSLMWVGAASGGLFTSANGGSSWSASVNFPAGLPISAIAPHPTDANVLLVGTGDVNWGGTKISGNGIYRSTDGGKNWAQVPATDPRSDRRWLFVNGLAYQPGNASRMVAGTDTGLSYSDDGGTTWKTSTGVSSGTPARSVLFDPNNAKNVVAASDNAILRSVDGGATFSSVKVGSGRVELAYAPGVPDLLYASANEGKGSIYKSTDGGQSWTKVSNPSDGLLGDQGDYGNVIWVDPLNGSNIVVAGVDIFRSSDGGVTFTKISDWTNAPLTPHADHHVAATGPKYGAGNKTFLIGTDGGLWLSSDILSADATGKTWSALNTGLNNYQFNGVSVSPSADLVIAGSQDNGTQKLLANQSATEVLGGDGGATAIDPTNPQIAYASYTNLEIDRATDGAASKNSFKVICQGITEANKDTCGGDGTASFYAPYVLDPTTPKRMLAGARSLWVTQDATASSVTWTVAKQPLTDSGNTISAIAVAPSNSDVVWVGHAFGDLFVSTNATASNPTWTRVTSLKATRQINSVTIDKDNPNRVFVTLAGYQAGNVQVTRDGGATWTDLSSGLPKAPFYELKRHPGASNWLYAGSEVGLYTSEDGGTTWSPASDGPGIVPVRQLVFAGNSTKLYMATYGRGVYLADTGGPIPLVGQSGWWWNKNAPGRGLSIEVLPGKLFMSSYHYGADGTDQWWIATATSTDGVTYSGTLQQYTGGQTLTGAYKAPSASTSLGTVTIAFATPTTGTVTWPASIGSPDSIERYNIVSGGVAAGPGGAYPETGWYWNANEGGRGWFLEVQNGTMFLSGFMYGATGNPNWYVAQAAMVSTTVVTGTLAEYGSGPIPGKTTGGSAAQVGTLGTVTLRFSTPSSASVPDSLVMTLPNGTDLPLVRYRF